MNTISRLSVKLSQNLCKSSRHGLKNHLRDIDRTRKVDCRVLNGPSSQRFEFSRRKQFHRLSRLKYLLNYSLIYLISLTVKHRELKVKKPTIKYEIFPFIFLHIVSVVSFEPKRSVFLLSMWY